MDSSTVWGLIAAVLTTLSFFPQVVKTLKTKSAGDFSVATLIILMAGLSMWIIYGFFIMSVPVIFANIVTVVLVAVIFAVKVKYG